MVLAVCAPRAAHRLAPRPAAWSLAAAALVASLGWLGSLALLAFAGLAQVPEVAEEGRWSVAAVRASDPVYLTVAGTAALALLASVTGLTVAAVRQLRHLRWARRECRLLPGDTELAVLDMAVPEAFALPGAPGRIVVSRGMLRCLGDREREALLAHERAHLRGRHHLFQTLWRLSAAANPLLRPLSRVGGFVLERWADEEAAVRVGDRTVVAHAVGRAALVSSANRSRPALAATGGAVPQRVRALLAPPPPAPGPAVRRGRRAPRPVLREPGRRGDRQRADDRDGAGGGHAGTPMDRAMSTDTWASPSASGDRRVRVAGRIPRAEHRNTGERTGLLTLEVPRPPGPHPHS